MRVFLPEVEIGDLDGFTPETDIFGRKVIGDGLSHLIATVDDPLVMAVDAPWGAGKSVFLRQWAGELRKAGYPVVYFDAFKNDYVEDVFAALAGEVISLVEAGKRAATPKGQRLISGAVDVTKIVARSALRAGVKIATLNALDTKEFEESAKTIGEELSQLEDRYLGELLTRQKEATATIENFKVALGELPALISSGVPPRPLVFIVDELDRCRPAFALEVLERIKHFFSVPNVHFVLGAHIGQLRNSVVAAYGAQMDAGIYLQKFIHLVVQLGETRTYKHERTRARFIDYLTKNLDLTGTHRDALDLVLRVAEARDLSLRTIERIVTNVALAYAFLPPKRFAPPPIVSGLCTLKVVEPELYRCALHGALSYAAAAEVLGFPLKRVGEADLPFDARWWAYCTDGPLKLEERERLMQSLWNYNFSEETNLLTWVGMNVVERLHPVT